MLELITEIAQLQSNYTLENTPLMQRRGLLIRKELPSVIRDWVADLKVVMGEFGRDLIVQGKDGEGRKSEIPWVRIASESRSPSAADGWYLVYLFCADGSGVYLALAHASTEYTNGQSKSRDSSQLLALRDWARERVLTEFPSASEFEHPMDLRGSGWRSHKYEASTAFAKFYAMGELPSEEQLKQDVLTFSPWLSLLYREWDLGRGPSSVDPIVAQEQDFVSGKGFKGKAGGQGFKLTGPQRKAIELHAMEKAHQMLTQEGFTVKDVSGNKPFDFEASLSGHQYCVEVKGTTGFLRGILLTRNEVDLHRDPAVNSILIVVHEIELSGTGESPEVSGGTLSIWNPWILDDEGLMPVTYQYALV